MSHPRVTTFLNGFVDGVLFSGTSFMSPNVAAFKDPSMRTLITSDTVFPYH